MEASFTKEDKAKGAQELEKILTNIEDYMGRGASLKDLSQFDDKSMEAIYSAAYALYETSAYEKALPLFQFLCFYDHYNTKYFFGLAGCQKMLGQFEAAVITYSYLTVLDASHPEPPFYAADCHARLGRYQEAESGYYAASIFSKGKPRHKELHKHAVKMHQLMSQRAKARS